MSMRSRHELELGIARLERRIAEWPLESPFGRLTLENRLLELRAELATAPVAVRTQTEANIVFSGAPVSGQTAIDAAFAGSIIQATIRVVESLQGEGEPPPLERMMLTGTLHGSFGFRFVERQGGIAADTRPTIALRRTAWLMAAAKEDDVSFEQAIAETTGRVGGTLKKFLSVLKKAQATFRFSTGNLRIAYSYYDVASALQRVTQTDVKDDYIELDGVLTGAFSQARRFEFLPDGGSKIEGSIADTLDPVTLGPLYQKRCHVYLMTVETTATARTAVRKYKLLQALPLE